MKTDLPTELKEKIAQFEAEHKNLAVAYGGDGTLLDVANKTNFKQGELYARLKTWHLLASSSGLANNAMGGIGRGLELQKHDFPMFRRYKIVLSEFAIHMLR